MNGWLVDTNVLLDIVGADALGLIAPDRAYARYFDLPVLDPA